MKSGEKVWGLGIHLTSKFRAYHHTLARPCRTLILGFGCGMQHVGAVLGFKSIANIGVPYITINECSNYFCTDPLQVFCNINSILVP